MDLTMSIANTASYMKQTELMQNISLKVLDKALETESAQAEQLVQTINKFGGAMSNARGITPQQLRHATQKNICKINVDSDLRLAMTAAVRQSLATTPTNFNPREYLGDGIKEMTAVCINEIKNIMGSDNKLHPCA